MPKTLLLCTLLAGCNAAGGAPAYLMLDADARQAGMKIELAGGWSGTPLLPLELRAGEAVTLAGEGFRVPLELAAGQLRQVRGVSGDVVTSDVDPDRLSIDGSAGAVRELADLLAAKTLNGENGLAVLEAPDLYGRMSFLTAPEAIVAVYPEGTRIVSRTPLVAPAPASSGPGPVVTVGEVDPRAWVVGFYVGDGKVLVLNAEGGFTLDDQRGRWVFGDGAILIQPDGGDERALTLDAGRLKDVDGTLFNNITEVCK